MCILRIVESPSAGPRERTEPQADQVLPESSEPELPTFSAIDLGEAISRRDQQQRLINHNFHTPVSTQQQFPDVLIVVIESLRPELIDAQIMPSTWRLAEKGIHCRNHYSGGNSTNLGMFSLMNGLEAIWWKQPVRYSPIMNRVYRQAGYKLGFFGGHDDWRTFYMDGYINDEHFDVFKIEPKDWLDSDRKSASAAKNFLASDTNTPKLAVLYLYSTHADYRSDPADRLNQPAAEDGFIIPYSGTKRDAVWNRYCNSARTIDKILAPLLSQDRIVVITRDHGQAFLEDGTCGHGTRISKVQNQTPAVIFIPNGPNKQFDRLTSHIDLLPTVLAACRLNVLGTETL